MCLSSAPEREARGCRKAAPAAARQQSRRLVSRLWHIFMDTNIKRGNFALWNREMSLYLLFRSVYGSIVPRTSQRSQNRRLKHLYKTNWEASWGKFPPCLPLLLSVSCSVRLKHNDFSFIALFSQIFHEIIVSSFFIIDNKDFAWEKRSLYVLTHPLRRLFNRWSIK